MVTPEARRELVKQLREQWKTSERQACRVTRISPTVVRHRKRPERNLAVRKRICELAAEHPRLGDPMLYDMLRNEGFLIVHKRLERLYRLEKL